MIKIRKYDLVGREKIREYLKDCKFIADFGCNEQKIRIDAIGFDINPEFADFVMDFNNLSERDFDNYKDEYDGLCLSHLIEHIIDTRKFLGFCYSCLKEGGRIAIICPDGETVNSLNLGDGSGTHEMLFTPTTLKIYLENAGFKKVHAEYYYRPYAYKQTKGIFACGEKEK